MNEFTATLDEFLEGRCEFVQVESTLRRALHTNPSAAPAALAAIDDLHGAGRLPLQLYRALKERIAPSDDRTRLRPLAPAKSGPTTDAALSQPSTGTGSTWSDPSTWTERDAAPLGPGSSLKGRFVLERVVGRGGMGVVYKARDLRKVEAQDRDPFVAIKVLNDDFRRHPESLKALQREARKAQTLAHPNIATVFDFDRDGATVYIQMEFLDGEPLDKLTKRTSGLPYAEAYPLIAGMGRALSYAHGKGIVHSDFKPGNCFVTAGNVVKVFDFGIARAAKPQGSSDDDRTRFDPGTLGALTPAYASCEMLEGQEPDPRDDIYALGCVAYELLAGRHPFDKRPATEARDAKAAVPPIKSLGQRQFRALQRALAFERERRTPTVAAFLEELGERKLNRVALASGIAVAGALAAAGFAVLPGYFENRRVEALVADFASADEQRIDAALETYAALEPHQRILVLEESRDALLAHFRALAAAAVNPSQGRYDYPRAEEALRTAQSLIPDSATLSELLAGLERDKNDLLLEMRTRFTEHLAAGRLLPAEGPDNDVGDVLAIVAQASPNDPLLRDQQLVHAYAETATAALERADFDAANAIVAHGLERAPDDVALRDLRDRVTAAVEAQASAAAARAAAAAAAAADVDARRAALDALIAEPRFDAAWESETRGLVAGLEAGVAPDDPGLQAARTRLAELYVGRAAAMRGESRLSEADRLLGIAEGLAPNLAAATAERAALDERRRAAAAATAERQRAARLDGLRQTFLAAAAANELEQARTALAALQADSAPNDAFLTADVPPALAAMFERLAREALGDARLDDAERLLAQGLAAVAGHAPLLALQDEIRTARAATARLAGQPCTLELAGFGARGTRGQCWDMISADVQAPRLVVVPAGDGFAAPFAIGRFEIAVGQWNAYCRASNACEVRAGADTDPLSDVAIDAIHGYTAWLSTTTGQRYRLPTAAEWAYAAGAPRDARNDDNCVVAAAGRGGVARSVTQGQQNGWGLLNYQGNVRELTETNGVIEARGGSYRDPLEACTSTTAVAHDGSADAVTGFRVVRELR